MGLTISGLAFLALSLLIGATSPTQTNESRSQVARGRYLVEEVAKCPECHTPRDDEGNLDKHAWLQGAPIWITPVHPIKNWADTAPPIAGSSSYTEAQLLTVLEKGTGPNGEVLRPPMHIYHLNKADAHAIVAYLQTVSPFEK